MCRSLSSEESGNPGRLIVAARSLRANHCFLELICFHESSENFSPTPRWHLSARFQSHSVRAKRECGTGANSSASCCETGTLSRRYCSIAARKWPLPPLPELNCCADSSLKRTPVVCYYLQITGFFGFDVAVFWREASSLSSFLWT